MQALILRVLVVDDNEIVRRASAKSFNHKLTLRLSARLLTEPMPSVRFVSTDRMWCYSTSRCQ